MNGTDGRGSKSKFTRRRYFFSEGEREEMRCERTAWDGTIDSGGRSVITGHGCTALLMWTLLDSRLLTCQLGQRFCLAGLMDCPF